MTGTMSVGFSPKNSVLGGLKKQGRAGAAAYGQAMAGAAGLEMDKQAQDQQLGLQKMRQDMSIQQQKARQNAEGTTNRMREQTMSEQLGNRAKVFDTSMNYGYRQMARQKHMRKRQAALDIFARML